jgi:hypothetical protein
VPAGHPPILARRDIGSKLTGEAASDARGSGIIAKDRAFYVAFAVAAMVAGRENRMQRSSFALERRVSSRHGRRIAIGEHHCGIFQIWVAREIGKIQLSSSHFFPRYPDDDRTRAFLASLVVRTAPDPVISVGACGLLR